MLDNLIEFFSFSNINVLYVTIGTILIGMSASVVGCFAVLRKRALIGDVIAHSVLPGLCLAFILFDSKNPLVLLSGAFITGWLSILVIDFIVRHSRLKTDAAIGLTLSVFFGFGMLLLTSIQHSGNASQSGLDRFLFGKAASMVGADLQVMIVLSIILLIAVLLFFRPFMFLSFDREYALSIGMPIRFYEFVLSSLTVLAVVVGIQAVGVVLMSAMLISPAVAARFLTNRLPIMLLWAAFLSAISCLVGVYISFTAPAMPTGPWIIVTMMIMVLAIIFLAPKKGILSKKRQQKSNFKIIFEENILKLLYQLGEPDSDFYGVRTVEEMQRRRDDLTGKPMGSALKRLISKKLIAQAEYGFVLTEKGLNEGKRMVRIHRLYELYLTQYLHVSAGHVHETADAMEHILTPEMELELEKILDYPEFDPHNSKIPYN